MTNFSNRDTTLQMHCTDQPIICKISEMDISESLKSRYSIESTRTLCEWDILTSSSLYSKDAALVHISEQVTEVEHYY